MSTSNDTPQQPRPRAVAKQDCRDQLLAEYNGLRSEIVARIGLRHAIEAIAITLLGGLLVFKGSPNQPPLALLAYPTISLFFAISWVHNHHRISEIGAWFKNRRYRVTLSKPPFQDRNRLSSIRTMVAPKAFLDPDFDIDPDTLLPWFEPGRNWRLHSKQA